MLYFVFALFNLIVTIQQAIGNKKKILALSLL